MNLLLRGLLLFAVLGTSIGRSFDLQQFMQETQRLNQGQGGVTLAWWIPTAYWEHSLKQSPNVSPKQLKEVLAVLEPYTMFAMVRMEAGVLGTLKTKSRSEMLDAWDVKFAGKSLDLAQESQLSPEIKNLLTMLKPMMATMLGQMGQGLEFVIYPNVKAGNKIIDPMKEGKMEAQLFDATFSWRLPLGSLLPARMDPKTGETFPGNYKFNPFTGTSLVIEEKKAAANRATP